MYKVLSIIREQSSLDCLPCDRVSLDYGQFTEYQDSDEHPAERPFEHPALKASRKRIDEIPLCVPSILMYFLDGSRRTYKIADVILDNRRYLPMIAGQIGVAVVRRSDDGNTVLPLRNFCRFENVIAFPDSISENDVHRLEAEINQRCAIKFNLLRYRDRLDEANRDPVDLGIARIMSEMHDIEIEAVRRMEAEQYLSNNYQMLVIDGPLRFKKKFDLVQFRNVIGLSKTFRPTFTVGKGSKKADVGSITAGLRFGERTSVFRTAHEDKIIGMWYLRIRQPSMMASA
jgi:hypothetical protein